MGKEILRSGSIPAGNIQDSEQESGCEKFSNEFSLWIFHYNIPANSQSLGVSLPLFEIKYDLTPDFSKKVKSHSFSTFSLLNCVCGISL